MQINAGLFSLALAGFAALAAAQPHGKLRHRAVHDRHLMQRNGGDHAHTEIVTSYVTVTGYPSASSVPSTTYSSAAPTSSPTNNDNSDTDNSGTSTSSSSGVDSDFPDGKIDCDKFPSDYGAVPLTYITKKGWSGIQVGNGNGDAVGECVESALCSYACPPGYSKSQWPSDQPASGESHGGLLCQNGKLHLTRPSYKKLCQPGVGGVTVQNMLPGFVSVCRTDYPGTENMVVPLGCSAGSTSDLTVPDSDTSYTWQGKPTSAQYYVNPQGTSLQDGCRWGKEGGGIGNWAPMIFGAGSRGGLMWLSISQNQLCANDLGYNVAIIGGNSVCKYEDGQFSTAGGCTTAVQNGKKAKFVLYPKGSSAPSS